MHADARQGAATRTAAIVVEDTGGPELLRLGEVELAPPAPGEVRVRHTAIGLNFIDVYLRTGLYPPPQHPFVPGLEGAGVVTVVGRDVRDFAPGDRVAYASRPLGAYAHERNLPAARAVRLPAAVDERLAAAALFKGLTAEYLVRRVRQPAPGEWVLVHSAAGGVGSLLVQWAKHLGARVLGVVSTEEKAAAARADGAEEVFVDAREDFLARTREVTGGRGCVAVYDGVGHDTFLRSIECVGVRGTLASYGQSSGPVPPFEITRLSARSIFLTRPSLFHYTGDDAEYQSAAAEVLRMLAAGRLRCRIGQTFPLAEAEAAHRALEGRKTSGSTLLIP